MVSDSLFPEKRPRLLLIDGHALLYRAYHAFPPLMAPESSQLVNAAYGFSRILLKSIRDFNPLYIAVAFDTKGPTFRTELYQDYKAHRPPTPEDFIAQVPIAHELITALNIPQFALSEYEADDVIGTITRVVATDGEQPVLSTIISGDKDLLQLVDDDTHVWLPGSKWSKDREYDTAGVTEKMGVAPEYVIDLKGLMGDPSDNIPGVKGVGSKTALKLLNQYHTLEGVYRAVDELEGMSVEDAREQHPLLKGAVLKRLLASRDEAFLSKQLATIKTDVPLDFSLADCKLSEFDKAVVAQFLEKYGFQSLIGLLPKDEFEMAVQGALF